MQCFWPVVVPPVQFGPFFIPTGELISCHNAFTVTPLTIGRTVLKESDDLDILGATFDSKVTS